MNMGCSLEPTTIKRHGQNNYILSHRSATSQREMFCLLESKDVVSMSITGGKPANPMLFSVPFCLGTSVQPYRSYNRGRKVPS